MSDIAIRAVDLGKEYHIGGPQKQYRRLGDRLVDAVVAPVRRTGKLIRGQGSGAAELDEKIWALQDVNFEIKQGEVVGIIGRNGAGKSTLLKLLSRITEPTHGYADIYGRVGSLLEVGTGFHPELTGRENIYLNGAIIGMRKLEIDRKFDEIVTFAEIDQFIDTPVKHYSSGMYVRLAFAVAAHLETDILLIDEVLAVGDLAFQQKCLGKMGDVAQQGRTVLFVSHNIGLIQTLCQRGIFLDHGGKRVDASAGEAVDAYLLTLEQMSEIDLSDRTDRKGKGQIWVTKVDILDHQGTQTSVLKAGEPARFVFHLNKYVSGTSCIFVIFDNLGQHLVLFESSLPGAGDTYANQDGAKFTCEIDELLLLPGRYRINVTIRDSGEKQDVIEAAAIFDVVGGQHNGRPLKPRKRISVYMPHRWISPGDMS